ncbi:hypothetical protein [Accumulibacter sp.]|uniref:O-antigen ligase family protein n=1 Tax=Accumulibacter sp. TaxID=2053492 RepID=UPI002626D380|nr:hypothetical protein [Accumulibacter sp.]
MSSAFSFFSFFPYPALPLGKSTGLQIAHVLSVVILVTQLIRHAWLPRTAVKFYFIWMLPLLLSASFGTASETVWNATAMTGVALLATVAGSAVADRLPFHRILTWSAAAILLQSALGVVQQISYQMEHFPFAWLFVNPSFAPLDTEAAQNVFAVYTKRSFGLFPEPSAMFASVGPWLVILLGLALFPSDKRVLSFSRRGFYLGSVIAGTFMIYLSRTGGAVILLCGFLPVIMRFMFVESKKGGLVRASRVIGIIVVMLYIGDLMFEVWTSRLDSLDDKDASWNVRMASLIFGITASLNAGEMSTILFGYGLDQVVVLSSRATGGETVHSVLIGYVMGTGLVGVGALFWCFSLIYRSIASSRQKLVGLSVLFVWLCCGGFVTGYNQLLPMWIILGVLLRWGRIFPIEAGRVWRERG